MFLKVFWFFIVFDYYMTFSCREYAKFDSQHNIPLTQSNSFKTGAKAFAHAVHPSAFGWPP